MIAAIRRAFIGAEKGFVRGRDILGACKMSWVETNTILMQEWKEKGRDGSRVGSREGSKVGEGSIALPATSPCNIAQLIRLTFQGLQSISAPWLLAVTIAHLKSHEIFMFVSENTPNNAGTSQNLIVLINLVINL